MQCSICLTQTWASYKMLPEDVYSVKHIANEIQVCTWQQLLCSALIKKGRYLFSIFFSKYLLQESNYTFLKPHYWGYIFNTATVLATFKAFHVIYITIKPKSLFLLVCITANSLSFTSFIRVNRYMKCKAQRSPDINFKTLYLQKYSQQLLHLIIIVISCVVAFIIIYNYHKISYGHF